VSIPWPPSSRGASPHAAVAGRFPSGFCCVCARWLARSWADDMENNRERRTAHPAVSRGPEGKLVLQTYQRRAARAAVIGASLRSFVYGRKYGTNEGHVDISAGRRHEREMSCVSSCGVGVRAVEDATLSTIKLGPSAASDQSVALHLSTCRRRH
jgi:hypothetical protein